MQRGPFRSLPSPLVSADWLRDHLLDPDVRVLDARWYLGGKSAPDDLRLLFADGAGSRCATTPATG